MSELPDGQVEPAHDDAVALTIALRKLPEMQRRVIELKFLLELTNDETAAALGKTVGAVNTQQWRALRRLRRLMDET